MEGHAIRGDGYIQKNRAYLPQWKVGQPPTAPEAEEEEDQEVQQHFLKRQQENMFYEQAHAAGEKDIEKALDRLKAQYLLENEPASHLEALKILQIDALLNELNA